MAATFLSQSPHTSLPMHTVEWREQMVAKVLNTWRPRTLLCALTGMIFTGSGKSLQCLWWSQKSLFNRYTGVASFGWHKLHFHYIISMSQNKQLPAEFLIYWQSLSEISTIRRIVKLQQRNRKGLFIPRNALNSGASDDACTLNSR